MNLKRFAKQDLKIVKQKGVLIVTNTKVGHVEIRLTNQGLFRFINFNTGEDFGGHHANTKKEAVEFLTSIYEVVGA